MEIDNPCEFPHHGKFYWNSAQPYTPGGPYPHNGDWQLIVQPSVVYDGVSPETYQVTRTFELQNLTVTASPEYIVQGEDGAGGSISYTLEDAFTACQPAQQTGVTIGICSSDGTLVRGDTSVKLAAPSASSTYVWDGKDGEGNVCPPGVYTYLVMADQFTNQPIPFPPGGSWQHLETDYDKSRWTITGTSAEVLSHDEASDLVTVRVGFMIWPGVGCPPGEWWEATSAKVDVFDPDGQRVGGGSPTGTLRVMEPLYVDVPIQVTKDGNYVFLVSAVDSLNPWPCPMNTTHQPKPLQQHNVQDDLGAAVCMFYGDDSRTPPNLVHPYLVDGIKEAWSIARRRWVVVDGKRLKVVAGDKWISGNKWKQMTNPDHDHAHVMRNALYTGGRSGRSHVPPSIWVVLAHGGGGEHESAFLTCDDGYLWGHAGHKCAIAADPASVQGLTGWSFAYVSDIPQSSLRSLPLAIVAGCSSGKRDAEGGPTIGNLIRQKSDYRTLVLGFIRMVGKPVANYWLFSFFDMLCGDRQNAMPLDLGSVKN